MDVEFIVKRVQRQFGDETEAMITPSDIFDWINEGQIQIMRRTGGLKDVAPPIPLVIGDNIYALPTDFFKVESVLLDGKSLQKMMLAQLRALYPTLDSVDAPPQGFSKFFAIRTSTANNADIILAPVPGVTGTLTINYIKRPPRINQVTDDLTIPDAFHSTLLTFCLAKAKQLDGDDESYLTLVQEYRSDMDADMHDEKHKDESTFPFIRASTEDSGYYYQGYWY